MAKAVPVFISYATTNKKVAGKLQQVLGTLGIESFLAHEKKMVSDEWRRKILEALDACKVYVAIITGAFLKSSYAQQEAGYAFCLKEKIRILSLCFGQQRVPPGFLEAINGLRMTATRLTADHMATLLLDVDSRLVLGHYIKTLKEMWGYRETEKTIESLVPYFSQFTVKQAQAFVEACISNSQIWDATECKTKLIPEFIKVNGARITKARLRVLKNKITDN